MNIGIDIDDTIAKFSESVESVAKIYDKSLRNTGILNDELWVTKGKYDWTKDEISQFESFVFEKIIENLEVKEYATEYVNKLYDEGNKIIFITKRSKDYYKTPYESTKKWLDKNGFKYNKIIINASDKVPSCKEENIDVFVDDRHSICLDVKQAGIKTIMLISKYNKKYLSKQDILVAYDWKQVYKLIKGKI